MSHASKNKMLRSLPPVEEVLNHPDIRAIEEKLPRSIIAGFVRRAIEDARHMILDDSGEALDASLPSLEPIVGQACRMAHALGVPSLHKVINVSGVIIHTNLGRSILPEAAVEAVHEVMEGYSTLEYNPQQRARGSRHAHYESLICSLTGAEAAFAVNNNAAAVMMVLSEFAQGREAIVSRGELVEIGGSFRIPDIMRSSQATMVEVGTTNRTHLSDYENALSQDTALLLKVHPSNYKMIGFTESVDIGSLRTLADRYNGSWQAEGHPAMPSSSQRPPLLVYEDQGSGSFMRLDGFGDYAEPTVAESLEKGCDLVSFSGDKLLGGPQAGIIVGKKKYIERLRKNPLARALRLDKMTLAALEATLRIYLDKERALREIPTLRMLTMSEDEAERLAAQLEHTLDKTLPSGVAELSIVKEIARAGGGSLPMSDIPSYAVRIGFLKGNAQECGEYLISERKIPVITRIKKEVILCDARTLANEDEMVEIARAFKGYFENLYE